MHEGKAPEQRASSAKTVRKTKRARPSKLERNASSRDEEPSITCTPSIEYAIPEDVPVGELQLLLPAKLNLEHVRLTPTKAGFDQVNS
jgi:hypothetical protein